MEYVVGVLLSLGVGVFAAGVGFDRERSFFATVLCVVGSYYVLFATLASSARPLGPEIAFAVLFAALAAVGFRRSPWLVVAGIAGHGVFDSFHHRLIENDGVPAFWPGFCLAFDVGFGAWAAFRLLTGDGVASTSGARGSVVP